MEQSTQRTRTESEQMGAASRSHVELQELCPECAKNFDGMSNWVFKAFLLFAGGLGVLFMLGWCARGF